MLVSAPAKLNRYIAIKGKRPDGYHDLELISTTLEHVEELCDEIELEQSPHFEFISEGPESMGIPNSEDNLALKALRLLETKWCTELPVYLRIYKRIPHGAGLGGGSSDAAAVLKSLPVLFNRSISESELLMMASELGSDVPLFILGGTILGLNKGEKVHKLPSIPIGYEIIVNPKIHISTKEVYQSIKDEIFPPSWIHGLLKDGKPIPRRNDLTSSAFRMNSKLEEVSSILFQTGGEPMLCGSGGCFSAMYASKNACNSAVNWLKEHKPNWNIYDIGLSE